MKISMHILILICLFGYAGNASQIFGEKKINIIPKPLKTEMRNGEFVIDGNTKIVVCNNDPQTLKIATDFATKINKAKYFNLHVIIDNSIIKRTNEIRFCLSDDSEKYGKEGYSLDVSSDGIFVEAHQANGLFYAVQTIYQLLPYQIYSSDAIGSSVLKMPNIFIFDKPRFSWRGNMLDPSRHFISTDYIKQNIDYLASLKMNKFHWHLTDDQGWRIEILSYPKLTEIGAWRVDRNNEPWVGRKKQQPGEVATYGGYYTQEQIKEIIEYANERYIEIIPEIDIPGHSRAAIAAYPEISCTEEQVAVATGAVSHNNSYCPGKEITFEFTEKMLNEVMDLFPSKYMHIGGDECNKESWENCEHCQKRISDNNLTDEKELQSYFIKRVEKIINARGKTLIGWDEILEGGLAPNATVMSWRGTEGGITAAKLGHDVVMSPWGFCYLDLKQGSPEIEPDYGYGQLLLPTAYSFNPIPDELTTEEAKHILGVQGNLWGESMQKPYDHNYMLFPRLFAISEVGWTQMELKDYDDFIRRTEYAFNRLDAMNVNYSGSMYNVNISHPKKITSSGLYISLFSESKNTDIHYTLDNSNPTNESPEYSDPILVNKSLTIKARSFKNGEVVGRISSKTINIHKAAGKAVTYQIMPNEKYNTSRLCLTDGLRGSVNNLKDSWVAFHGSNMELEIDLDKEENISTITASFLHSTGSWIFLPVNVIFEISIDGKTYTEIEKVDFSDIAFQPGKYLKECTINFTEQKVRFIRIIAESMKVNPDWHTAKGGKNWIFIDEVIVN